MLVIPDVKIAVLFNPRTGSHTLHNLLWELCRDRLAIPFQRFQWQLCPTSQHGIHLHLSWWYLVQTYPDLDLSDYRAFAFWRDPQDWFLSALDYMTRKSATSTKVGIWHKNMSPRAFWESDTNMKRQTSTIASRFDAPDDIQDIELFSFHDFNNEIIRLFKELEVDVTPKMIEDNTILAKGFGDKRVLTDKDKAQIRKYWWEDYHYLEYKGIELPK